MASINSQSLAQYMESNGGTTGGLIGRNQWDWNRSKSPPKATQQAPTAMPSYSAPVAKPSQGLMGQQQSPLQLAQDDIYQMSRTRMPMSPFGSNA